MAWKIVSLLMLFLIFALVLGIVLKVLNFPGVVAREREHPQASAIETAAWLGLVTGGITWVIACVWAHARPIGGES